MACKSYGFGEMPDSVSEFFKQENKGFFSSIAWYENLITAVLANEKQWDSAFLTHEQDNTVQVVLPVKFSVSATGTRTFENLANYYSPVFQIISSVNKRSLAAFFNDFKLTQKGWDTFTLRAMPEQEVIALQAILKRTALPSIPFYCFANWYLDVKQRTFDEYFSELSSRVKNTVNRKTKQFNRLENAKIEIVYEGKALEKGIKAFESVYALSWKEEETYPAFISGLMKTASNMGALRLAVAHIDDQPVAAQLWIVADNTAYIYKLAYDEKYKKLSIGSILTATLMRHVIDVDKVSCVDYLSGDDNYKKEWMSDRRERWGLMIFNWRSAKGCLKMLNEFTRFYVKKYFS